MKLNKKLLSRILLMAILMLGLSLTLTHRGYAMAQISLQNNSKLWLNLYIDGNFGCGPVMPNGFCTSSVKEGSHLLEARKGEEVVSSESGVNIGDGTSPTWTVTIEDPEQVLIKKDPKKIACAQAFGGVDQDKLIQNIATCVQDIRAAYDPKFTAHLRPASCQIYISMSSTTTPGCSGIGPSFKYCVEQYGWTLPIEVLPGGCVRFTDPSRVYYVIPQ